MATVANPTSVYVDVLTTLQLRKWLLPKAEPSCAFWQLQDPTDFGIIIHKIVFEDRRCRCFSCHCWLPNRTLTRFGRDTHLRSYIEPPTTRDITLWSSKVYEIKWHHNMKFKRMWQVTSQQDTQRSMKSEIDIATWNSKVYDKWHHNMQLKGIWHVTW